MSTIERLAELAKGATQGPWRYGRFGGVYEGTDNGPAIGACTYKDGSLRENGENNERFIAACNPAAITQAAAEYAALRERNAELHRLLLVAHRKSCTPANCMLSGEFEHTEAFAALAKEPQQ